MDKQDPKHYKDTKRRKKRSKNTHFYKFENKIFDSKDYSLYGATTIKTNKKKTKQTEYKYYINNTKTIKLNEKYIQQIVEHKFNELRHVDEKQFELKKEKIRKLYYNDLISFDEYVNDL